MNREEFIPYANVIDIWRIALDLTTTDLEKYQACLNEEELQRAEKLKVPEKQNQFIISRASLKIILSGIIEKEPCQIKLNYSEQGKPYLKEQFQGKDIFFNLSHSGSQAIIALTLGQEIGIDIQQVESGKDYTKLSQRFFSKQEKIELSEVDEKKITDYFYSCWTRKEAFIKAIGDGLGFGLNNFDVSIEPECSLSQIKIHKQLEKNLSWFNINVDCVQGYVAALAVSDPAVNLRNRTITV